MSFFVAYLIPPQRVFEVSMSHVLKVPGMAYCSALAAMKMCH